MKGSKKMAMPLKLSLLMFAMMIMFFWVMAEEVYKAPVDFEERLNKLEMRIDEVMIECLGKR